MTTFTAAAPPAFITHAPQVYSLYLELESGGVIELEDGLTIFEIEESPGGTGWSAESPAAWKARI